MLHTILMMMSKIFKVHSSSSSHRRPQRLTTAPEVNVGITENPSRSSFSPSLAAGCGYRRVHGTMLVSEAVSGSA